VKPAAHGRRPECAGVRVDRQVDGVRVAVLPARAGAARTVAVAGDQVPERHRSEGAGVARDGDDGVRGCAVEAGRDRAGAVRVALRHPDRDARLAAPGALGRDLAPREAEPRDRGDGLHRSIGDGGEVEVARDPGESGRGRNRRLVARGAGAGLLEEHALGGAGVARLVTRLAGAGICAGLAVQGRVAGLDAAAEEAVVAERVLRQVLAGGLGLVARVDRAPHAVVAVDVLGAGVGRRGDPAAAEENEHRHQERSELRSEPGRGELPAPTPAYHPRSPRVQFFA
jgi:hypothetical protein